MNSLKRWKVCLLLITAFAAAAWIAGPFGSHPGWAGQGTGKFLADRHQGRGMNCASCHKESPPKSAVPSAVCSQCHGNKQTLAQKTKDVMPNPHDSHMELACEKCHHGHKRSENGCAQCHEFEFKVP